MGRIGDAKINGLSVFQINAVEVHDSAVYVAQSGGVVSRSTDWGDSWQQVGSGLPGTELLSLAAVDIGGQTWVYCGTIDAGIWRALPKVVLDESQRRLGGIFELTQF